MEAVIYSSLGPFSLFNELVGGNQSIILAASFPVLIYVNSLTMDDGHMAQTNII